MIPPAHRRRPSPGVAPRTRVSPIVPAVRDVLVLVVAIGGLVVGAAPVRAQTAPTTDPPSTTVADGPPAVIDPRVAPALAAVAVSSPAHDRAMATYTRDWRRQQSASARQTTAQSQLAQLAATRQARSTDLAATVARHDQAAGRVAQLRASVRTMAVALYVGGGSDPTGLSVLDPAQSGQVQVSQAMIETVSDGRLRDLDHQQAVVAATQARAADDLAALAQVAQDQSRTEAQLTQATRDLASATTAVAQDQAEVADTRLTAPVTGLDVTLVVLDAYWKAAATVATRQPACHLGWSTLAGIGRVESRNGTFGGDQVSATGEEATPIIGIPLDGTAGTQLVPDTDGGALDGDATYDHAVGPMQVLPSSWRRYGQDGNGDGRADPQNMYDAALAAGVMLCRYEPLDTDAGLQTAFYHYNPSAAYVAEVLGYTHAYAAFTIPPVT